MNKEECETALEYMHFPIINTMTEEMAYETLKKLINEHFENKPLKFIDLKIGEPYWDNKEKEWCYFVSLHKELLTGVKISISKTPMMGAFQFEENRFYKKEVKEDE